MYVFKLFFGVCIADKENCRVRDLAYEHMDMTVHSEKYYSNTPNNSRIHKHAL